MSTAETIALEKLDPIYKSVLLDHDQQMKLEYCTSKLFRVKQDLKKADTLGEKASLIELERSLNKEIQLLKNDPR